MEVLFYPLVFVFGKSVSLGVECSADVPPNAQFCGQHPYKVQGEAGVSI